MRDCVAPWFHARKPLGIAHAGSFAVLHPQTPPKWLPYSHTEVDGYAAVIRLLQHYGISHYQSPGHRRTTPPGILSVLRAGREHPAEPANPASWRVPEQVRSGEQLAPAWTVFSVQETTALKRAARRQRLWLTSLLLWALHRVVVRSLVISDGGGWLYPVSLRGAYPDARDDHGNYVGGFYLNLPAASTAEQVQAETRQRLRAMAHWSSWYQARLASWLPQTIINLIYRYMLKRNRFLGSFSYGGECQVDFRAAGLPEDCALLACAPGSPNHPVGNGMIICNGRLSMALRVDPVLGLDAQAQQSLLNEWRDELLSVSRIDECARPEVSLATANV